MAYSSVSSTFFSLCSSNPNLVGTCNVPQSQSIWNGTACFAMTEAEIAAYPTVTLNIQGINIVMPPSTYLTRFDPESNSPFTYCNAIRNTGFGGLLIIGDTSMSGYYVIFDNVNTRIGWATVNTENCGSQNLPQRKH